MRQVYRWLTRLAEPLAGVALKGKAREESAALHRERLGYGVEGPVDLWFHAASLGETAALDPILSAVGERHPELEVAVTTSTATGRQRMVDRGQTGVSLAPLDFPRAVARSFQRLSPGALLLVETELWPNWLMEARTRGIPVALVNGRVSDRTWPRYRLTRGFWRPLLASFQAVAARTNADAERFRALGVTAEALTVTGNCKHDGYTVEGPLDLPWPSGRVVVLASVHPQEAEVLLPAVASVLGAHPETRFILIPRHVDTTDTWMRALRERDLRAARWSEGVGSETAVLVLDAYGLSARAFASGGMALVGGGYAGIGGHNPMEAAAQGLPLVMGPDHHTVEAEVQALTKAGGLRVAKDAGAVVALLTAWLGDDAARLAAGKQAQGVARANRGAVKRTLDWLEARGVILP